MERDRKREILAAENAERLARALAAKGVYVIGGVGRHGLDLVEDEGGAAAGEGPPSASGEAAGEIPTGESGTPPEARTPD